MKNDADLKWLYTAPYKGVGRRVKAIKDTALLDRTDTELDAMLLVKRYKARFQIEFLFRDAKQHPGLVHCQSTRKEAIHTQVNASLTALNLLKVEARESKQSADPTVISIASWKRRKFNQHFMQELFDELGLSRKQKSRSSLPRSRQLWGYRVLKLYLSSFRVLTSVGMCGQLYKVSGLW